MLFDWLASRCPRPRTAAAVLDSCREEPCADAFMSLAEGESAHGQLSPRSQQCLKTIRSQIGARITGWI